MSTFIWVLVMWTAFSFIYMWFFPVTKGKKLFGRLLDFVLGFPAILILVIAITVVDWWQANFKERK